MGLAKIQKVVREFTHTSTSDVSVITIDPQDLDLAGGDMYSVLADGAVGYLVNVKAMRVSGTQTKDGSFERTCGFSFRGNQPANTRMLVLPNWAQQAGDPTTFKNYVSSFNLDIRMTGRASDDPNAVNGSINIIINEVELSVSDLPATYKVFVDVYAYGTDVPIT